MWISHPAFTIGSPPSSRMLNSTIIPVGPVERSDMSDNCGCSFGIVVKVTVLEGPCCDLSNRSRSQKPERMSVRRQSTGQNCCRL